MSCYCKFLRHDSQHCHHGTTCSHPLLRANTLLLLLGGRSKGLGNAAANERVRKKKQMRAKREQMENRFCCLHSCSLCDAIRSCSIFEVRGVRVQTADTQ